MRHLVPVVNLKLHSEMAYYVDDFEMKNVEDALKLVVPDMIGLTKEVSLALFFTLSGNPICIAPLAMGNSSNVTIPVRDVVTAALMCNAEFAVLVHNHPHETSKQLHPSKEDEEIVKRLGAALDLVQVSLLDSFVVGTHIESGKKPEVFYHSMRYGKTKPLFSFSKEKSGKLWFEDGKPAWEDFVWEGKKAVLPFAQYWEENARNSLQIPVCRNKAEFNKMMSEFKNRNNGQDQEGPEDYQSR